MVNSPHVGIAVRNDRPLTDQALPTSRHAWRKAAITRLKADAIEVSMLAGHEASMGGGRTAIPPIAITVASQTPPRRSGPMLAPGAWSLSL